MKRKRKHPRWFRILFFILLSCIAIWWLSTKLEFKKDVDSQGEVKSSSIAIIEKKGNEIVTTFSQKISEVVPGSVKGVLIDKYSEIKDMVFKQGEQVIEDSELGKQIKNVVDKAVSEITGFPEKQKTDLRHEALQQMCNKLLEQ